MIVAFLMLTAGLVLDSFPRVRREVKRPVYPVWQGGAGLRRFRPAVGTSAGHRGYHPRSSPEQGGRKIDEA
jgi:hypothetical protein